MQYLIFSANYRQKFCIKDEFDGAVIDYKALNLDKKLIKRLIKWNDMYQKIIPMDEEERRKNISLINKLDKYGKEFQILLSSTLNGIAKIKYYSEGKLTFIF